jgi:hypothetical protein
MDHDDPRAPGRAPDDGMPFWLSACSYWQPAHFPASAWTTHAPFAFWLMDVLRPHAVAELGSHFGYSCFVFAEAARRLGTSTTIDALDTWEGDDHAGFYGEDVHDAMAAVVARDYPGIVRMRRGYFSDTRPTVADAALDLLHIDGRHGYDDVLEDYTSWRSSVREGGVILFHDIAERDRGFEVWRLWEELSSTHPSFSFRHGHGLGVLAVGEPAQPALARLFTADAATTDRIRADYERLGDEVARRIMLEHRSEALDALVASASWRLTRPLRSGARLLRPRRP